jgi:hypothetical protein
MYWCECLERQFSSGRGDRRCGFIGSGIAVIDGGEVAGVVVSVAGGDAPSPSAGLVSDAKCEPFSSADRCFRICNDLTCGIP